MKRLKYKRKEMKWTKEAEKERLTKKVLVTLIASQSLIHDYYMTVY